MNQRGSNRGRPGTRRTPGAQAITPPSQPRLHQRVQSTAPSRLESEEGAPRSAKTTRAVPRKTGTTRVPAGGTKRVPIAPKKDNTIAIVAGAAGGLVLLIVVIAAASSGGTPVRRPKPKAVKPVEIVEEAPPIEKKDTGPITFACTGSDSHEDKEQMIRRCQKCDGRAPFYWDYTHDKFRCYDCQALFAIEDFTCPDCGKRPRMKPYIKHRPK